MSILITGDTHGLRDDYPRFNDILNTSITSRLGREATRKDYMIIAGDFGVIWNYMGKDYDEESILDELENLPWTTLFIDGNHENFDRLRAYKVKNEYGGEVSYLREHVVYLRQRGQVYTVDGRKIWCFGGGMSVDRQTVPRTLGKSYWAAEEPSDEEYVYGIQQLAANDWKVDYVITHAAPQEALDALRLLPMEMTIGEDAYYYDHLPAYLQFISQTLIRKEWFFGHYHVDQPHFTVKSGSARMPSAHLYSAMFNTVIELCN